MTFYNAAQEGTVGTRSREREQSVNENIKLIMRPLTPSLRSLWPSATGSNASVHLNRESCIPEIGTHSSVRGGEPSSPPTREHFFPKSVESPGKIFLNYFSLNFLNFRGYIYIMIVQAWHERNNQDPGHKWFWEQAKTILK
jgi:hypothetical protein